MTRTVELEGEIDWGPSHGHLYTARVNSNLISLRSDIYPYWWVIYPIVNRGTWPTWFWSVASFTTNSDQPGVTIVCLFCTMCRSGYPCIHIKGDIFDAKDFNTKTNKRVELLKYFGSMSNKLRVNMIQNSNSYLNSITQIHVFTIYRQKMQLN